jgi:hypothetical protein
MPSADSGSRIVPPRRPRVFVSHSGTAGHVGEVLDALEHGLLDGGYEPLVDRSAIPAGTSFHPQVDEFVRLCDAAVILISRRALDREHAWVFAEANQLRPRVTAGDFQVVPVLLEDVQPAELRGWEAPGIDEQNAIQGDDPAAIAATVLGAFEQTGLREALHPVVLEIARRLKGVSDQTLRDAGQVLAPGWVSGPLRTQLGRLLLRGGPEEIVAFAAQVALEDIPAAKATLNLAMPFTWVPLDAARRGYAAITGRRPVGLNTVSVDTPRHYLVCGWAEWPPWRPRLVGELEQGELVEELKRRLEGMLDHLDGGLPGDAPAPGRAARGVVLVVRCAMLDEELVEAVGDISGREGVGVVVVAYDQRWADTPPQVRSRVELLVPELDRVIEQQAARRHQAALAEIQGARADADFYAY